MSCDWDVYCVDCDDWCGISDANHQVELVNKIVGARAGFEILAEAGFLYTELKFEGEYIPNLAFFARHKGHTLRARNEYDEFDAPCPAKFFCSLCDAEVACERWEHPLTGYSADHRHTVEGTRAVHWYKP